MLSIVNADLWLWKTGRYDFDVEMREKIPLNYNEKPTDCDE